MSHALKPALLLAILLLNPAGLAASGDTAAGPASIRIELNDGLLTAEFHDAPLPQVLAAIGKAAGFKLVQVADFSDFPRIDGAFARQPLQAVIDHLVINTNHIYFFSPGEGTQFRRVLSQVWLLGPGEAGADTVPATEVAAGLQHEEAIVRRQAVLHLVQQQGEEAVLDKLAELLQTDQDPLVRARAAIALGSLGQERAVAPLESALRDSQLSVRAQSIAALGEIGGDRASMALGSILLDESIDPLERVFAAQALWKQDSEIAQSYLQAGSIDADVRVRDASSRAPAAIATPVVDSQPGLEATQ